MEVREALGSYEGFSVEERQALLELLNLNDSDAAVQIEERDDITVESSKGIEIIQCKSSVKDGTPYLRNGNVEFWKTVARWVEKTSSGGYGERRVRCYRYSISAASICKPRKKRIANLFDSVRGLAEAEEALNYAKTMMDSPSAEIKKSLEVVFSPEKFEAAKQVVDGFKIEHHPNLNIEMEEAFSSRGFVGQEFERALLHDALGWFKKMVADQSQNGNPPIVRYTDLIEHVRSAAEQYRRYPLTVTVGEPEARELEIIREVNPVYIRQLHAIAHNDSNLKDEDLRAISDRLRSFSQIIRWVEHDGLITQAAIDSYQDDLVETWRDERDEVVLESSGLLDSKRQGRKIYIKTRRESRHRKLAGDTPPLFVSNGQLHELADVDDIMVDEPRIVWNPSFVEQERSSGKAD